MSLIKSMARLAVTYFCGVACIIDVWLSFKADFYNIVGVFMIFVNVCAYDVAEISFVLVRPV